MSIAAKDIVSTFDQGSCGSNIITFCVKIFSCPIIALDNKVPKETSYLLPGLKVGMHCHWQGWYLQACLADTLIRVGSFLVWSVYPPETLFPHLICVIVKIFSCSTWSSTIAKLPTKRLIFYHSASCYPSSIFTSFPALINIAAKDIVSTFDQGHSGSNIITFCVKIFSCPTIVLDNKVANETSYLPSTLQVSCKSMVDIYKRLSWIYWSELEMKDIFSSCEQCTPKTFDQGPCRSNNIALCVKIFSCPTITWSWIRKLPSRDVYSLCKLASKVDVSSISMSLADTLIRAGSLPALVCVSARDIVSTFKHNND